MISLSRYRYCLGTFFILDLELDHCPETQALVLGEYRWLVEHIAARACPQELPNFREHWQLQLDLNQAPETRLGHRAAALDCVRKILRAG